MLLPACTWPHPAPPGAPGPKQLGRTRLPLSALRRHLAVGRSGARQVSAGRAGCGPSGARCSRRRSASGSPSADAKCLLPQATRAGLVLSACPFDLLENQARGWGAVSRQSRAPWLHESGPVLARGTHARRARPFFKPAAASGSWLQCAPWEDPALPHLDPDPMTSAPGPTPHLDTNPFHTWTQTPLHTCTRTPSTPGCPQT